MEEGKCNSFIHEIKNQILLLRNRETFPLHQVLCSLLNSLSSSGTPRSIQQQGDLDETHCCLQAQFTNAPLAAASCYCQLRSCLLHDCPLPSRCIVAMP